jgi:hypothetical protein
MVAAKTPNVWRSYQLCGAPRDPEPGPSAATHHADSDCGPRFGPWDSAQNSSHQIPIGRVYGSRRQGQPKSYRTAHFVSAGFLSHRLGTSAINSRRIGNCFGMPSWLLTDDLSALHFPFVPVQIMDGCLKALCAAPTNVIHQLPTPKPRRSPAGRNQTWLPELKRYLSHAWINDDYVAAKAAKSDAAKVPTALWDQRILLPLPSATGSTDSSSAALGYGSSTFSQNTAAGSAPAQALLRNPSISKGILRRKLECSTLPGSTPMT